MESKQNEIPVQAHVTQGGILEGSKVQSQLSKDFSITITVA